MYGTGRGVDRPAPRSGCPRGVEELTVKHEHTMAKVLKRYTEIRFDPHLELRAVVEGKR